MIGANNVTKFNYSNVFWKTVLTVLAVTASLTFVVMLSFVYLITLPFTLTYMIKDSVSGIWKS